jgi:hypothetical protein
MGAIGIKEAIMFCGNCGKEIDENAKFCPYCGSATDSRTNPIIDTVSKNLVEQKVMTKQNDSPALVPAILSCLFPIVGLILFLVWRKSSPQKAKICGKGTVVGLIIGVSFVVIKNVIFEGENISTNRFNKEGLTFSYPNDWQTEFEEVAANTMFFVSCENPKSSDMVTMIWTHPDIASPEELIENIIEEFNIQFKRAEFSSLYNSSFGRQVRCLTMDFSAIYSSFSFPDEEVYGKITAFVMNEYVVLITKQSDTKNKLSAKPFQLIEESFNVY